MRNHYKKVSSGFKEWDQGSHAEEYTIFASNIGEKLSIDEVSLSDGELYTLLTNKSGHGKNGTLVATINSTKSEDIINILQKIPLNERLKVTFIRKFFDRLTKQVCIPIDRLCFDELWRK